MAPASLDTLPAEVILSIADLLDARSILKLSETCFLLHQLLFDPNHDSIWRQSCLDYGVPASVNLGDLMVSGSDDLGSGRSWLAFCKLLKAWRTPFPVQSSVVLPSIRLASRELPQSYPKDTRYTISLACAGFGDNRGTISSVEDPVRAGNDGKAIVSVRDLVQKSPAMEGELDIFTAVIGPGHRQSKDQRRLMTRKFSAYPHQSAAGLLFQKHPNNWKVSKLDASTGQVIQEWDLGKRRPDRAATYNDILIAMTWDRREENDTNGMDSPPPVDPSHLVCVKSSGTAWSKKTQVLWEYDINVQWAEEEERTAFPILKIFHVTRAHLVALVTRHNPSRNKKLTATRFVVLDVLTGEAQRTITIPKASASNSRSSFLTTFNHNFVVNDAFLVCGGLGGDLDVWHYNDPKGVPTNPLYSLPSPFVSAVAAPVSENVVPQGRGERAREAMERPVPRFYSNLCISTCGRYIAATTSNQLWTFDLVNKTISSCHHNAREVLPHDFYARNPPDDFPSGIWLRWIEWHKQEDSSSSSSVRSWLPRLTSFNKKSDSFVNCGNKSSWKKGKTHTAYVTNIRSDDDSVEAYLRRRSRWANHLPRILLEAAAQAELPWLWLFAFIACVFGILLAVHPLYLPPMFAFSKPVSAL